MYELFTIAFVQLLCVCEYLPCKVNLAEVVPQIQPYKVQYDAIEGAIEPTLHLKARSSDVTQQQTSYLQPGIDEKLHW